MLFSAWIIVPIALFISLLVLFLAFITWLAHGLEGYPMLLLQQGTHGPHDVRRALTTTSTPTALPV